MYKDYIMGKKISKFVDELNRIGYHFWCQGCNSYHGVYTDGAGKPNWQFNGDEEKPTFKPSVLSTWTEGEQKIPKRCHIFVTDGKIQYLNDCTHELAGKTVDLIDWDKI